MGTMQWVGSALSFVAGLVVLLKLFQTKGFMHGLLGLVCMLYTYIWGWQNVKNESLKLKTWMWVWTAAIVVGIALAFMGGGAAAAGVEGAG